MNANVLYETINFAWAVVSAFMIAFLLIYLYGTFREVGLKAFIFDRPQPEQFAVAILITDTGNMIDRLARGSWRLIGENLDVVNGLIVIGIIGGSTMGMIGLLCKLRVTSSIRYGHGPWVTAAITTAAFIVFWIEYRS